MPKEKSTLESAERKWTENTTAKGPDYCEGVAKFLGVLQCNPAIERAYVAGVKNKGPKWARNYRKKMAGIQ